MAYSAWQIQCDRVAALEACLPFIQIDLEIFSDRQQLDLTSSVVKLCPSFQEQPVLVCYKGIGYPLTSLSSLLKDPLLLEHWLLSDVSNRNATSDRSFLPMSASQLAVLLHVNAVSLLLICIPLFSVWHKR